MGAALFDPPPFKVGDARDESLAFHAKKDLPKWAGAKGVTQNLETRAAWAMLAVTLEPIRAQTAFFLKASKEDGGIDCGRIVLDYLHPNYTPTRASLQYLRAAGRGLAPRLRLLFQPLGFDSMRSLCGDATHGHLGFQAIAMARGVSAANYRRIDMPRRELPFAAAAVTDARLERQERLDIADRVVGPGRRPCCSAFFFDKLFAPIDEAAEQWPRPEELLRPPLSRVLESWVVVLERALSVARLERRNHTTKTILTKKSVKFQHLAASSLLMEAKKHAAGARAVAARRARQDAVCEVTAPKPRKPKRGMHCGCTGWLVM